MNHNIRELIDFNVMDGGWVVRHDIKINGEKVSRIFFIAEDCADPKSLLIEERKRTQDEVSMKLGDDLDSAEPLPPVNGCSRPQWYWSEMTHG